MPRRKSLQLTPLELQIMNALWDLGAPATVQEVQERLASSNKLAYTTVQTMLNVLHRKGKVRRTQAERAFRYKTAVSRSKAVGQSVRDLVDRVFGGSAEALVMSLMETKQLTPEALARIGTMIEEESDES